MVDCVFMVRRLVYETEPLICGILASEIYATYDDFWHPRGSSASILDCPLDWFKYQSDGPSICTDCGHSSILDRPSVWTD